jgi:hypothetical protein
MCPPGANPKGIPRRGDYCSAFARFASVYDGTAAVCSRTVPLGSLGVRVKMLPSASARLHFVALPLLRPAGRHRLSFRLIHRRSRTFRRDTSPHLHTEQPPMNPGERPCTHPATPPPQLESVLGATPHEFESRILRQCLTGHDVEGPRRKVGPFVVVLRSRCPGFCPQRVFSGVPDGFGDLPGDVLQHRVGRVEVPHPHAVGGSRFPSHPMIWSMTWAGTPSSMSTVAAVCRASCSRPCRIPASSNSRFQSW